MNSITFPTLCSVKIRFALIANANANKLFDASVVYGIVTHGSSKSGINDNILKIFRDWCVLSEEIQNRAEKPDLNKPGEIDNEENNEE